MEVRRSCIRGRGDGLGSADALRASARNYVYLYSRLRTDRERNITSRRWSRGSTACSSPVARSLSATFSIKRLAFRRGRWRSRATESFCTRESGADLSRAGESFKSSGYVAEQNQDGISRSGPRRRIGRESSARSPVIYSSTTCRSICAIACGGGEPSLRADVSAEGLPLGGAALVRLVYEGIEPGLQTPAPAENTMGSVGLGVGSGLRRGKGRGGSGALASNAFPTVRRASAAGEGDYRTPYPVPADYATTPPSLVGVVMNVTRIGLSGASRGVTLSWRGRRA